MAFVHTVLEAVHAENTGGIYGTVPAVRARGFLLDWANVNNYLKLCVHLNPQRQM